MRGSVLSDILRDKVVDIRVCKTKSARDIVEMYGLMGGFSSKFVYDAYKILVEMFSDKDCKVFLSFTANLLATGLRGVISELIEKGFIDVIITTGGSVDHDVARALGGSYYHGDFSYDDAFLKEHGIFRLGNILIPQDSYGVIIEKFTWNLLDELTKVKSVWSVRELLSEVGARLNDDNSFLRQAYLRGVPVYIPGIVDSCFGTSLLMYSQSHKFNIDVLKDQKELSDIVFDSKVTGALMIGGGISKHHTIWWNQFKGGLDYAVYLTTAFEYDGSLSGAQIREAVSWGKVKPEAKKITVYGDATIILPILLAAVYESLNVKCS
ncbi:MAG: deoxyhypusine synthase [archaeon YNP-WB-040]|nr:deoxyhypusine synthase [Candidatus Culexarchaeum yellowstonense]